MTSITKIDGLPPAIAEKIAPLFDGREWQPVVADIQRGTMEVFEVNGDSYAVTRIESEINELVIVGYIGKGLREFAKAMIKIARKNGIDSIRFHTRRPGLARLIASLAPVELERVYRVQLDG